MLLDTVKGLWITLKHLFLRPDTNPFPDVEPLLSNCYRGILTVNSDCVCCSLCAAICPDDCITIVGKDVDGYRKPEIFDIDLVHCMFCGLCTEACPVDAIRMSNDYKYSVYDRDLLTLHREDLFRWGDALKIKQQSLKQENEKSV